jgi:predicted dehydrogenase
MSKSPVRIACVGIGGFGKYVCETLLKCVEIDSGLVQFVAACDKDLEANADWAETLRSKGISIYGDFDSMLETDFDAVWLPLPIHLHQLFTERALEAGKAVLCEKPAAGSIDELDAMIEARDRSELPVMIGFQDIYLPSTAVLKQQILDGEVGNIQYITVHACWPRDDDYYTRTSWAGSLKHGRSWVLDSPANNALSHFITLALFLNGPSLTDTTRPVGGEAELYRARDIQSFDTCSLKIDCENDVPVFVHLTHACKECSDPIITVFGDKGRAIRTSQSVRIEHNNGQAQECATEQDRMAMIQRFAHAVRGNGEASQPLASLEVARGQLLVVNAAMEACPIVDVAEEQLYRPVEGGPVAIRGIERLFAQLAEKPTMLHASGLAPWSKPARRMDLNGYNHFNGPAGSI